MKTGVKERFNLKDCSNLQIPTAQFIYKRYLKRPIDFTLAMLALIVLSPFLLIIALLVRIKLGSPVLFKQQRPGLNEKIFTLYKFRTMTDKKDKEGKLLADSLRLTEFGKFLRSTSLDELPELWNIVRGDMAIVGPRPLLVQYLPLYNEHQKRRHEVRPGLSGLAQVNGRNAISWKEKFDLDIEYVDSVSFIEDWKITFLTIKKVFAKEGINSGSEPTMEPFKGLCKQKSRNIKDKLIIIGAGGHGKVIADIAMKMSKWQNIVLVDDNKSFMTCMGLEIIGKTADAFKYKDEADFFIAVGNNATREKLQEKYENAGLSIAKLIHPGAVIGNDVEIGIGTVVMAGVVINSSSRIGKGCIINTGSSLDHDNVIEDYVHISPGTNLAGTVRVGKGSWIGIGSVVSNNIDICGGCIFGAGAVVVKDIAEPGTYIGVPVRRIER